MPPPAHRIHYTRAEYVELEASSNVKHEYLDGQIYAMAGGTPEHAALAATATALLFAQLRDAPCRAHYADVRVRVRTTGLATYPDVTVLCGPREADPEDEHAVTNPTLIVEVLSRSTEEYDRGDKFEHYKQVRSLAEYVLVSHLDRSVEVWTRCADDAWGCVIARERDVARLKSIGAVLNVRELYDAAAEPTGRVSR
jgi:Uma2 family endonuclease